MLDPLEVIVDLQQVTGPLQPGLAQVELGSIGVAVNGFVGENGVAEPAAPGFEIVPAENLENCEEEVFYECAEEFDSVAVRCMRWIFLQNFTARG